MSPEPTRTIHGNVEEMLDLGVLSAIAETPITSVLLVPFAPEAQNSRSEAVFSRVETNDKTGPVYLLKRYAYEGDWLMRLTGDDRYRSLRLFEYGLFDALPAPAGHTVVACAKDGEGAAILMRNVEGGLIPAGARLSTEQNEWALDAMAALHATFFDSSEASNPELGLCTVERFHTLLAPRVMEAEATAGQASTPARIHAQWQRLRDHVEADVADAIEDLLDRPGPFCRAMAALPHTLNHGNFWRPNLAFLAEEARKTQLLDWEHATHGPPALDLAFYLFWHSTMLPVPIDAAIERYRDALARRLGSRFDESWWRPQLELALAGTFARAAWAPVGELQRTLDGPRRDPAGEAHWRDHIGWWSQRLREGLEWL